MQNFKLPDPKDKAGKVLGIGLLAAVGLVVWKFLLPFLTSIVWGTVNLAIGIAVAAVVLYILLSPKFWRRMKIILDSLGELLFGWFIEMNPFTIMQLQLDSAEKDREILRRESERLKGQEDKLQQALQRENELMRLADQKMQICRKKLNVDATDEDSQLNLESAANEFASSKDYIDNVAPIAKEIAKLVVFADRAYKKSGFALRNEKNRVEKMRDTYDAVTAGRNAMSRALRAFTGDPELNKAGDIAVRKLREDISKKVGAIKNSIQLTSQIMNQRDLEDAAKVNLAVSKAEELDIDSTFDYVAQVDGPSRLAIPVAKAGNKYLEQLK